MCLSLYSISRLKNGLLVTLKACLESASPSFWCFIRSSQMVFGISAPCFYIPPRNADTLYKSPIVWIIYAYFHKRLDFKTQNLGKIMKYLLSLLLLAGCATPVTMAATGGSKADGIVSMSYSYGMFESPVVDTAQSLASAKGRCKAWGYRNAEAFDAGKSTCEAYNGYGNCLRTTVTVSYQCI